MSKIAHKSHTCQAVVVSCMDFRLQEMISRWAVKNIKGGFDRVAVAGGVKNLPFVLGQIELSVKLHQISSVYLINHEDCGAYGSKGTFEKHREDLLVAKNALARKFPKLKITLLYLKLNGEFVGIYTKQT
ncbi:hypothetical protein FJY90_06415 [Candidatus Gottesmanbacteria bacterium]|nr:hypothetical protein [Candidatus Gottesmanbacteria bacterium]